MYFTKVRLKKIQVEEVLETHFIVRLLIVCVRMRVPEEVKVLLGRNYKRAAHCVGDDQDAFKGHSDVVPTTVVVLK